MQKEDEVKNEIPQWKINILIAVAILFVISVTGLAIIYLGGYTDREMVKPEFRARLLPQTE